MPFDSLCPGSLLDQRSIAERGPVPFLHSSDSLAPHAQHGGSRVLLACRFWCALHRSELTLRGSPLELRPHLAGTGLPRVPIHSGLQDGPFVLNRQTLEDVIAGIGDRLLGDLGRVHLLPMRVGQRLRHNPIGLMAVLSGDLPVPMQDLCRRLNLLGIARSVRRYLGGSRSFAPNLLQVRLDLLPAWARRLKVLLAITLDFGLTMLTALDLIAKVLQAAGELRPVDGSCELLRAE